MKNSSYSSLPFQTNTWPLTQPNTPIRMETVPVSVHQGPTLHSWRPQSLQSADSPCVFATSSLFPPATSSIQVHPGAAQTSLFGRGGSHSPGFLPRILRQTRWAPGLGLQPPWSPHRSQESYCPKHSPYHLIFQWPLQFWPPIFIYAGIPLAVHSVPQKMG